MPSVCWKLNSGIIMSLDSWRAYPWQQPALPDSLFDKCSPEPCIFFVRLDNVRPSRVGRTGAGKTRHDSSLCQGLIKHITPMRIRVPRDFALGKSRNKISGPLQMIGSEGFSCSLSVETPD